MAMSIKIILQMERQRSPLKDNELSLEQKNKKIQDNFHKMCLLHQLPLSYSQAYITYLHLRSYQNQEEQYKVKMYTLSDESNLIKNGQSIALTIADTLQEREKVLKRLRSDLISSRNPKNINLTSAIDKLAAIRMCSLTIIQHLMTLARKFRCSSFPYFTQLVDKISRDVEFLRFSYLRRYIQFSSNHDPLFVIPLRKFQNLETTINYNKKSVVELFAVDKQYRKRLVTGDLFIKKVSSQEEYSPDDQMCYHNERDRFNSLPSLIQAQNEGTKRSILPQIQKKSLPLAGPRRSDEYQKQMVIGVLRDILEDYHHKPIDKDRGVDAYRSSRTSKKKRSMTQANEYSSIRPAARHQIFKKYQKYHKPAQNYESDSTEKKSTVHISQDLPKKLYQRRNFMEDQAQFKLKQSIRQPRTPASIHINIQKGSEYPSSIAQSSAKFSQGRYLEQESVRQSYKQADEEKIQQRIETEEPELKEKEQPVMSTAQIKPKHSKHRNNKIINRCVNQQSLKETIRHQQFELKNHKKQEIRNNKQEMKPNSIKTAIKNQSAVSSANEVFLEKIQSIKNMARSTPVKTDREEENQADYQPTYNSRFQGPLDKVSEVREVQDQEEERVVSRRSRRNREKQQTIEESHHQPYSHPITSKAPVSPINKMSRLQLTPTVSLTCQQEQPHSFRKVMQSKKIQTSMQSLASSTNNKGVDSSTSKPRKRRLAIQKELYGYHYSSEKNKTARNESMEPRKEKQFKQTFGNDFAKQSLKVEEVVRQQQKSSRSIPKREQISNSLLNIEVPENTQPPTSNRQSYRNINGTSRNSTSPKPQSSKEKQQPASQNLHNKQPVKGEPLKESPQLTPEQQKQRAMALLKSISVLSITQTAMQLKTDLKGLSPNHAYLDQMLNTEYFNNRHVKVSTIVQGNSQSQILAFCLHHPRITQEQRQFIIIQFEVVRKQLKNYEKHILNLFLKYFFTHDPVQKIYLLRHKNQLLNVAQLNLTKAPVRTSMTQELCFFIDRNKLPCNNKELHTTLLTTCIEIATSQPTLPFAEYKSPRINISPEHTKRLKAKLKSQSKMFWNQSELNEYTQEQSIPKITPNFQDKIVFGYSIWEDCLLNAPFYVHQHSFYFTIQPPYSFLHQSKQVYYLLLATTDPKRFLILGDKLYEDEGDLDIFANFQANVLNRKITDLFGDSKYNGKIVSCPQFKMQTQAHLSTSTTALVSFQLNWKEYIKGVRVVPQEEIHLEVMTPFFCGMVATDEQGFIRYQYTTQVKEQELVES